MQKLLACTPMLDLNAPEIQALITRREWRELDAYHRIEGIYNFVRDEILFGYNTDDGIPASRVLADVIQKVRCLWPCCEPVRSPAGYTVSLLIKSFRRGQ